MFPTGRLKTTMWGRGRLHWCPQPRNDRLRLHPIRHLSRLSTTFWPKLEPGDKEKEGQLGNHIVELASAFVDVASPLGSDGEVASAAIGAVTPTAFG